MSRSLIPVDGRADLARDPVSGAVLVTSKSAYESHKRRQTKQQNLAAEVDSLRTEVGELKTTVLEMVGMLKEILRK